MTSHSHAQKLSAELNTNPGGHKFEVAGGNHKKRVYVRVKPANGKVHKKRLSPNTFGLHNPAMPNMCLGDDDDDDVDDDMIY